MKAHTNQSNIFFAAPMTDVPSDEITQLSEDESLTESICGKRMPIRLPPPSGASHDPTQGTQLQTDRTLINMSTRVLGESEDFSDDLA